VNLKAFKWRGFWGSPLVGLVAVYLGYVLLSALWSRGFAWLAMADLVRLTLLVLLFFTITVQLALYDDRFAQRLFFWFALTAGASLIAVFSAVIAGVLPYDLRLEGFGIASHPIIGATLYGFALLVAAFVLLPHARSLPERLLWLAIIALCAAFMLLASSRGPLLALATASVVGLALADRRMAVAVIGILVAGLLIGLFSESRPIQLIFDRPQSGHFSLWKQALEAISEHPWRGHGSLSDITFLGKRGPQRSPHNLLLANQFYGGLPASLLLAALLGGAALRAVKAAREGASIYLVLLIFGLTASLFDSRSLVQNLGREWITLWLPIGLLAAHHLRDRVHAAS